MLVILNTGAVLKQKIDSFKLLSTATESELNDYIIISNGTGVHWNSLDEDLSLKGFLKNFLANIVGRNRNVLAA